jgi:hypothetical protein
MVRHYGVRAACQFTDLGPQEPTKPWSKAPTTYKGKLYCIRYTAVHTSTSYGDTTTITLVPNILPRGTCTFIRGSDLLPTYHHRIVLHVQQSPNESHSSTRRPVCTRVQEHRLLQYHTRTCRN